MVLNGMSVDVEDYFQVSAFERHIHRRQWDTLPARVDRNTHAVLDLFAEHGVAATFFVLGWVAERFPDIVTRIVAEGHELASHGYEHTRVTQQQPAAFKEDVSRTKKILEDLGAVPVLGYRAASYSIGRDNLWAHDVLTEAGYRYSSSIYPIAHDLYGMPEAPRFPYRAADGELLEVPISTLELGKHNIPCGGGGYFRLLPYVLSRWAIRQVNDKEAQPCVFYFHPWEIDPEQPRQRQVGLKTRFRHYVNLSVMRSKLDRLLKDFSWQRMDRIFLEQHAPPI